ncbi:MAG TPA: phosphohydrolase [Actinomycetota bacterium]|nr:phosphohydrolase [Actinomycetota bacterium]
MFTVQQADLIAWLAHLGVDDKSGVPYIEHPRRVAARLEDPTLKMVALLHDVLEDTEVTAADLRWMEVPERVVIAVEAITHPRNEPNVTYWERVRQNEDARRVKLADIADNTDPARLVKLDPATVERLTKKYARALQVLS